MRFRRDALAALCLVFVLSAAVAAESAPDPAPAADDPVAADSGAIGPASAKPAAAVEDVWAKLAGMAKELEAEELELRDETISAHLSYLTSLEEALKEVDGMAQDDPRLASAWARVEYLVETSFRLLESTGEYDAFLRTTAGLRLAAEAKAKAKPVTFDEVGAYPPDEDGGLLFEDAGGKRLLPARLP